MVSVKHRDIVDELKEAVGDCYLGSVTKNMLGLAIAEIERLRRKAGAVSGGESFGDIRRLSRLVDAYNDKVAPDNSLIAADRIVDKPSDTE